MHKTDFYHRPVSTGWRTLFRAVFAAVLGVVIYKSLTPSFAAPTILYADKVMHFLAYGALTVAASLAFPKTGFIRLAAPIIALGIFMEFAQIFGTSSRTGSVADVVANVTGVGLACVGMMILVRLYRMWRQT